MQRYWKYLASVYLAIGISYILLVVFAYARNLTWRADFTAFYTGWTIVRQGLSAQLYDIDLQFRLQHEILAGYPHGVGILAFYYPPHVALLFSPLSYLPLKTAYVLWLCGQLVILGVLYGILWRQTQNDGWTSRERLVLLSGIIALPSMWITLQLGTFSLFMLLCIVGLYYAVKANNSFAASLWLVLGSIKPQVILLSALALLFSRRWRILAYATVMMFGLVILSSAMLGWEVWLSFISAAFNASGEGYLLGVIASEMINLRGMLTVLWGVQYTYVEDHVSVVFFFLSVIATALLWAFYGSRKKLYDLLFGMTYLLSLLFGFHVNPQDGLLITVPAYLLYQHIRNNLPHSGLLSIYLSFSPLLLLIYKYTVQKWVEINGITVWMIIISIIMIYLIVKVNGEYKFREITNKVNGVDL